LDPAAIISAVHLPAAATPVDYLVLGHLARDLTPDGPRLGGTVAYAALTARALGLRPAIVTAIGADMDLSPLDGLPLLAESSPASTTFDNRYDSGNRTQVLVARASRLSFDRIPEVWATSPIVHLGPIADEIPPALATAFASAGLLGVTAQGWLRTWSADGRVMPRSWEASVEGLSAAGAVVVSLEDLGRDELAVEGLAGICRLLVVTDGPRGARVHWNGDVRRIPAPPAVVVDPTGAGDIFAAAFFIRLRATRDPWEAARFAHVLAAASVERRGLAGVPTAEDVLRADLQVVR
jgi:sugar/nucleoside kinase (ribokinase family)